MVLDLLKETVLSFRRDNCMNMAASIAFYTSLSLIPSLFFIAYFSGTLIGSSKIALIKIQDLLNHFLPRYSDIVLKEVKNIIAFKKGLGIINLFVLFSTILPLASSVRTSLMRIFRIDIRKPLLIEKLIDSVIIMLFISGLTVIAMKDFFISLLQSIMPFFKIPLSISFLVPGISMFLLTLFLFIAFTFKGWKPRLTLSALNPFNLSEISQGFMVRMRYLIAGAFMTSILWFSLKPLFNLMLKYNPGYGFTFGSFKSLFVIIIWIYYSQVVFLFGAEFAATLQRKEAIILKRAILKYKDIPEKVKTKYVVAFNSGEIIFNEDEPGYRMYYILKGSVSIEKSGKEIGRLEEGSFLGEIAFLLNKRRTASARAISDTELLIIDYQNIDLLGQEMPEFFKDLLKDMALKLERTGEAV